jgi:FkbM family methyltransferase
METIADLMDENKLLRSDACHEIFAKRRICPNPFVALEIGGTGKTAVCCHTRMKPGYEYVGNILEQTLDEIWNSPQIQYLRKVMYDGVYDTTCKDYCPQLIAFRNGNDPPWYIHNCTSVLVEELQENKTEITSPYRAVSIASDGSCNLVCIMCRRVMKTHPTAAEENISKIVYADLEKNIDKIFFLELTGNGDPFYNVSVLEFLSKLSHHKELRHLTLRFITNAMALDEKSWNIIESLHVKELRISVSIDAATKETYESIRVGARWGTLVERMNMLSAKKKEGSLQHLQVTYVVMKRNIDEMIAFIELARSWNCDKIEFQRIFGTVTRSENIFDTHDVDSLRKLSQNICNPVFSEQWIDASSLLKYKNYHGKIEFVDTINHYIARSKNIKIVNKLFRAVEVARTEGLRVFTKATVAEVLKLTRISRPALSNPDEAYMVFQVMNKRNYKGTIIDVGAHFGGALAPFAQSGWNVYCFEPDSRNRSVLVSSFGNFPNVTIDKRAVADSEMKELPFFRSGVSTGISGLSAFHPSHVQCETVNTTTLGDYIEEHAIADVDFLKIDTEGYDLFVLKGMNWDKIMPRMVICEFEDSKTLPLGYDFHQLAGFLKEKGYKVIVSEWFPVVEYGGSHKWRRFAEYPCKLQDSNAWGNLFAVKEENLSAKLNALCRKYTKIFRDRVLLEPVSIK